VEVVYYFSYQISASILIVSVQRLLELLAELVGQSGINEYVIRSDASLSRIEEAKEGSLLGGKFHVSTFVHNHGAFASEF